jgi:hypothetical protein
MSFTRAGRLSSGRSHAVARRELDREGQSTPRSSTPVTVLAVVGRSVTPGVVDSACQRLGELLRRRSVALVICDVSGHWTPDVCLVDLLARIALIARRARCRIGVVGASAELLRLIDLCGLADVLAVIDDQASSRGGRPKSGKYFAVSRKNVIPLILPLDVSTT